MGEQQKELPFLEKGETDKKFLKKSKKEKKNTTPDVKVRKRAKKQNYFNNADVEALILKYKKGGEKDLKIRELILKELDKIVFAIINKYHFYYYYEYDDLVQQGRIACIDSLHRFDMKKVKQKKKSVFSYFSLVVKKNLRFFTINKNRKLYKENITDFSYLSESDKFIQHNEYNKFIVFDTLINRFKNKFKTRQRMYNLVVLLDKYVKKISDIHYKQRDFIAYCKSFGYTSEYVKKFLNEIKSKKNDYI